MLADAAVSGWGAKPRRFCSATSISSSWRRRVSRASRSWAAASGSGAAWAARARRRAEDPGVELVGLGQLPGRAGKVPHLARVGDDDRQADAASAAIAACSKPPVASATTKAGRRARRRATSCAMPASSFVCSNPRPLGRTATSSVPWRHRDRRSCSAHDSPGSWTARRDPTFGMRVAARATVRAFDERERQATPRLTNGLKDPRPLGYRPPESEESWASRYTSRSQGGPMTSPSPAQAAAARRRATPAAYKSHLPRVGRRRSAPWRLFTLLACALPR